MRASGVMLAALLACGCSDGSVAPPDLGATEVTVRERILARHRAVLDAPTADNWLLYAYALDAHEFSGEAEQAYLRAAELDEQRAFEILHLCAVTTRRVDLERARSHFRRALTLRDDYMPTHLMLAEVEEVTGNIEEAKNRYALAAKRWSSAHAELGLGRLLLRDGDAQRALPHLEKARQLAHKHAPIYEALARAYARLGRLADGRAAAKSAGDCTRFDLYPDPLQYRLAREEVQSGAHLRRADMLVDAKRYREAAEELRAALAVTDYLMTRLALVEVLASDQQLDEAITEVDFILQKYPKDRTALENRARILIAQGKRTEALSDLKKLLQVDPQNAFARQQLGKQ